MQWKGVNKEKLGTTSDRPAVFFGILWVDSQGGEGRRSGERRGERKTGEEESFCSVHMWLAAIRV